MGYDFGVVIQKGLCLFYCFIIIVLKYYFNILVIKYGVFGWRSQRGILVVKSVYCFGEYLSLVYCIYIVWFI